MPHELESKLKYESDKLQLNRYQTGVQTIFKYSYSKVQTF